MPSAATNRRGVFLNCRFAVNGIQKASRLLVTARAACDMECAPEERNAGARPRAGLGLGGDAGPAKLDYLVKMHARFGRWVGQGENARARAGAGARAWPESTSAPAGRRRSAPASRRRTG